MQVRCGPVPQPYVRNGLVARSPFLLFAAILGLVSYASDDDLPDALLSAAVLYTHKSAI